LEPLETHISLIAFLHIAEVIDSIWLNSSLLIIGLANLLLVLAEFPSFVFVCGW